MNFITIDDMKKELEEVRENYRKMLSRYGNKYDNIVWYSNALDVADGLLAVYGNRCHYIKDMVRPNMFATQPDISKEKYDLFGDILEKVDWNIFPVISVYSPSFNGHIQQDGHTRSRLFVDAGKSNIVSYIIEAPEEYLSSIENEVLRNGMEIGVSRPRVSHLHIKGWGVDIVELGYRRFVRDEEKSKPGNK